MKKKIKKTKNTEIYLKINFEQPNELWNTGMNNFLMDQIDRFELIEGKKILNKKGYMYWCRSYLDAKVWQTIIFKKYKIKSSLYWDLRDSPNEIGGGYVVIAEKTVPFKVRQRG